MDLIFPIDCALMSAASLFMVLYAAAIYFLAAAKRKYTAYFDTLYSSNIKRVSSQFFISVFGLLIVFISVLRRLEEPIFVVNAEISGKFQYLLIFVAIIISASNYFSPIADVILKNSKKKSDIFRLIVNVILLTILAVTCFFMFYTPDEKLGEIFDGLLILYCLIIIIFSLVYSVFELHQEEHISYLYLLFDFITLSAIVFFFFVIGISSISQKDTPISFSDVTIIPEVVTGVFMVRNVFKIIYFVSEGLSSFNREYKRVKGSSEINVSEILNKIPMMMSVWTQDNPTPIYVNDAVLETLGVPAEQREFFKNSPKEIYKETVPEIQSNDIASEELMNDMLSKAANGEVARANWIIKKFTGEKIIVERTIVKIKWGGKSRFVIFSRDLTDLSMYEENYYTLIKEKTKLEITAEAERRSNDQKSLFLANMSHEIRTPLNVIIGMCELIDTKGFTVEQKKFFSSILKTSNSLLELVNELLDFSKIEAGVLAIESETFCFSEFADSIKSSSEFLIEKTGLAFSFVIKNEIPDYIISDKKRLRQIVMNLIGNAAKYTRQGIVALEFSYELDEFIIVVSDTGIGIKKENLSSVFNAYCRIDKNYNKNISGAGLGLYIVKKILESMGGTIFVDSVYGRGSVFRVAVPAKVGEKPPVSETEFKLQNLFYHNVIALIVDDNEANCEVAEAHLNKFGIVCDKSMSGQYAIVLLQTKRYDIIFMDHMMPDMDGIETTQRIKKLPEGGYYQSLPIIALTANASANKEIFKKAGMSGYIPKPINRFELAHVLYDNLPKGKISKKFYDDKSNSSLNIPELNELQRNIVDIFKGIQYCADNEAVYLNQLLRFKKEHLGDDNKIRNFIEVDESPEACMILHTLKGVAKNIGALALAEVALRMEAEIKSNGVFRSDTFAELRDRLREVGDELAKIPDDCIDNVNLKPSRSESIIGLSSGEFEGYLLEFLNKLKEHSTSSQKYFDEIKNLCNHKIPKDKEALLEKYLDDYDYPNAARITEEIIKGL